MDAALLIRLEEQMKALSKRLDDAIAEQQKTDELREKVKLQEERVSVMQKALSGEHGVTVRLGLVENYASSVKGGLKVLYVVIILFGGAIGTLYLKQSDTLSSLKQEVQTIHDMLDFSKGASK